MGEHPSNEHMPEGGLLVDRFGRSKRKLRVSLTDRCNFRCSYCMPENPEWLPKSELLSYEELRRVIGLFVTELGMTHLRLTGGEPLMRKGVPEFIASLDPLRKQGLQRISLTTNGALLDRYAEPLRDAGLDDLNISIDSLDPVRFRELTDGDIDQVLAGIDAARAAGLSIKLNAVVIRDYNEMEVLPLARWAKREGLSLRFIEFMPLDGGGTWSPEKVVSEREILDALSREFTVDAIPRTREPATYYLLDGDYRLGVISTVSNPFCRTCDRLRLAATGEVYPCLFSPVGVDLRPALRGEGDDEAVKQVIRQAVWRKGEGFIKSAGYVQRRVTMHAMGG